MVSVRLLDVALCTIAFFVGRGEATGYISGREAYTPESIERRACRHGRGGIVFHVEEAIRCLRQAALLAERYRSSGQMPWLDRLIVSLLRKSLLSALARFERDRDRHGRPVSKAIQYMSQQAHKSQLEALCGCGHCSDGDGRKRPISVAEQH